MKVALLCNGTGLEPVLETLAGQRLLAGVAMPEAAGGVDINTPLESALDRSGIPFLRVGKADLHDRMSSWLQQIFPDAVCSLGFPFKIPASLLEVPRLGFFNIHGGALPQYRGPAPVFWQIKNGEHFGAVVIHAMTDVLDAGGIAHGEQIPIGASDTYGLYMQRLGAVLPRVLIEFIQQLAVHGEKLPLVQQAEAQAEYLPRPSEADLTIDWTRPAAEIDALVRACNPIYGGAASTLKGVPVRMLEVATVSPHPDMQTKPGTIVAANARDGLCVACGQGEVLKLDILYSTDGFFSGQRLVKIFGLKPGDTFSKPCMTNKEVRT